MRSITFDESTVLRELARIMGEKEMLVKQAAGETMPSTKVHAFDEQLLSFPVLNSLNKGQRITDGTTFLKELLSPEFKRFSDGWVKSPDAEGKNKMAALKTKILPYLTKLQVQLKKMSPQHQETYIPAVQNALALMARASSEEDFVKQSAEKLYDVSKETGEDLINSAHPGGGTSTELTHSKTKENLVETIVEQQKVDIEVAQKAPKGTYAALVILCDELTKLGFGSKLKDVKNSMISIATTEEIADHVLMILANKLDKLGNKEAANKVDDLLKKLPASPTTAIVGAESVKQTKLAEPMPSAQQAKAQFINWLNGLTANQDEEYVKQQMLNMTNKLDSTDWNKFLLGLASIGQYGSKSGTGVGESVANEVAKVHKLYPKANQISNKRQVVRDPKVLDFQKKFNKMFAGKYKSIKEDGILGSETKGAQELMRYELAGKLPRPGEDGSENPFSINRMDKSIVVQELRNALDTKFRNAKYLNSPVIKDYLNQEADKIVQQYTKTPNATSNTMKMWVDQVISGLTPEDIEKASRG